MTDPARPTFSNRLDLDRFFYQAREQVYVIVKPGDFPNYYPGGDIDVFCYDKSAFARVVLSAGNAYLDQGFQIEVTDVDESHTHVDFVLDGEIEFRFDLYGSLPQYRNISLKAHYLYSVIENAATVHRETADGVLYPLYVPAPVDDCLLRYVEYVEWYELRPDKVKHLEYILSAIASDPSRIGFLDKLHLYTELPSSGGGASPDRPSEFGQSGSWVSRVWTMPIERAPGAFLGVLRRAVLVVPRRLYRALRSWRDHRAGDG